MKDDFYREHKAIEQKEGLRKQLELDIQKYLASGGEIEIAEPFKFSRFKETYNNTISNFDAMGNKVKAGL